jgi:hypothetical protein
MRQNRKKPAPVPGDFTRDGKENPTNSIGVAQVELVDLSPMIFHAFEWRGRRLKVDPPLTLVPTLDEESGRLYKLIDQDLGIDVFAPTRGQLANELAEQVLFTWDAYAREAPEKLTSAARRLRETLLGRMREKDLATQPEKS